jgi:hypothetical protein
MSECKVPSADTRLLVPRSRIGTKQRARSHAPAWPFLLLAVCAAQAAHADQTFCVDDFAGLKSALATWTSAPDGSTITIQLVRGSYDFDNASGATLDVQQALHAASINVLGGYAPGCADEDRVVDARNTVIDGQEEDNSRFELFNVDGDALLEGITFTGLVYGVEIIHNFSVPSSGHQLAIDHASIVGNANQSGELGYTVRLWGFGSGNSGADVTIRNSLIADNDDLGSSPSSELTTGTGAHISLSNSTIANNRGDGITLQSVPNVSNVSIEAIDDIAWHNGPSGQFHDLDVSNAPTPPQVTYSIVGAIVGAIEPTTTNSDGAPHFLDPGAGNFRLGVGSPALDSGAPGQPDGFPTQDLDGNPRVLGTAIDRGAYEALPGDLIFYDGFNGD